MKKSHGLMVGGVGVLLALLGCLCSGTGLGPAVQPSQTPSVTSGPTAAVKDFTRVRLHHGDGDLSALIKAEAAKAVAAKRHPFLEFDATWCPPCIAIGQSLDTGDALMVDAFSGTAIIQVDIDDWKNDLAGAGYTVQAIPIYYELDASGRSTGRTVDGGAWGDNIPENMAPPLKAFFHQAAN